MSIIQAICRNPNLINDIAQQVRAKVPMLREEPYYGLSCFNLVKLGTNVTNIKDNGNCLVDSVIWNENKISVYESNIDVISFDFTGCMMAKIKLGDMPIIAHIHCAAEVKVDTRYDFAHYLVANNVQNEDLILFKPLCDIQYLFPLPEFNNRKSWGVITREDECYTILVNGKIKNNSIEYSLDSIYQHITNRSDDALYNAIRGFYVGDILRNDENTFKTNRDKLNRALKNTSIYPTYSSEKIYRIY